MTTVITTVGTSLITNYMKPEVHHSLEGNYTNIQEAFENIEKVSESKYDEQEYKINITKIQDAISNKWIKGIKWVKEDDCWEIDEAQTINRDASAEISSLLAIQEKLNDSLEVRLIATETILSRLAAEVIQDKLNGYKTEDGKTITVEFEPEKTGDKCDVIQGLDVENPKNFRENGLPKLIERLKALGISKDKIILNITGGYKGVIPFLTILGQIYENVEIMYLYEESKDIIEIPKLPVSFDIEFCDKYFLFLQSAYRDNPNDTDINKELIQKQLAYLENGKLKRSALGEMLWDYVDKQPEENLIGTSFEMLFHEYFSHHKLNYKAPNEEKETIYKCVWRSLNHPHQKHPHIESDFDLTLKPSEDSLDFITVSIKSYSQVKIVDNSKPSHAVKQLKSHIEYFKRNQLIPKAFFLIIFFPPNRKIEELNDELCQMKELIRTERDFLNTGFEVRYVLTKKDKGRNSYQNILKDPLLKDDLKPFTLNKHV